MLQQFEFGLSFLPRIKCRTTVVPVGTTSRFDFGSSQVRFRDSAHTLSICQLLVKGLALRTNKQLRLSLPRKSEVRITDHPGMTSAVYRGRKAKNQTKYIPPCSNNNNNNNDDLNHLYFQMVTDLLKCRLNFHEGL